VFGQSFAASLDIASQAPEKGCLLALFSIFLASDLAPRKSPLQAGDPYVRLQIEPDTAPRFASLKVVASGETAPLEKSFHNEMFSTRNDREKLGCPDRCSLPITRFPRFQIILAEHSRAASSTSVPPKGIDPSRASHHFSYVTIRLYSHPIRKAHAASR